MLLPPSTATLSPAKPPRSIVETQGYLVEASILVLSQSGREGRGHKVGEESDEILLSRNIRALIDQHCDLGLGTIAE